MLWSIASYCVSLFLLAVWAFFYTRLDGYRKWVFMPMFLTLMGFAIIGFVQSLGYPLPLWAQFIKKDINVSSFIIDEPNNIIYVWGYPEGGTSPISLEMEFNREIAEQLTAPRQVDGDREGDMEGIGIIGKYSDGVYEFQPAPPVRLETKD